MDIRVLRYFLVVAREESFSRAADALYLSQPTLSRQIREMEEELGVQLLTRTNRNVRLTQEGMRLRRRAQEIVDLMDKTKDEFTHREDEIAGDIFIGCGETQIMRQLARVMIPLQKEHPGIRFHLYSANAAIMVEEGMGIALCLDRLADTSEHSNLTFRPLAPRRQYRFRFVWKKYQIFTPAADVFLQKIRIAFSS